MLDLMKMVKKIVNDRFHYLFMVFTLYTILGVIGTYPLLLHITDSLPLNQVGNEVNSYSDTLETYYCLWLFKDNLLKGTYPFHNQYEFSVNSHPISTGLRNFPLTLLFVALSFFGDIFAYNSLVLLSFPLSGLGMYLLVEYLTKNKYSGIIAGTLYAIAPFRVGETVIYGHTEGFMAFFLPFIIYFYEKSFTEKDLKSMLWAGTLILMLSLTGWHLTYYILLFTMLYIPFKLLQSGGNMTTEFRKHLRIFTILLIFIISSIGGIILCKSQSKGLNEFEGWDLDDITRLTPPPLYFFLRDPMNEFYLGFIPLSIIAAILLYFRKLPRNPEVWFYTLILSGSFILALGPDFPSPSLSLYSLFYNFMPYFDNFRSPGRVTIMIVLSMAVLLGFAIRRFCITGRTASKRSIQVFMSIILLIVIADCAIAPIKIGFLDENNKVYYIIKNDEGNKRLLGIPIVSAGWPGNSVYDYYITIHEKKIINGYKPFPPAGYDKLREELKSLNLGEINKSQYLILKEHDVGFVLVHENLMEYLYGQENTTLCVNNMIRSQYLDFIDKDNRVWLFKLN